MVALDVEQSAPMLRRRYENDPSNRLSSLPQPPPGLPPRHPLNILKRCSIIGGTVYALYGEFFCCLELQHYNIILFISSILLCSLLHNIFTPHTPQLYYYSKSPNTIFTSQLCILFKINNNTN